MPVTRILIALFCITLMSSPQVMAEEDKFSPGNSWLRESQMIMESITELQVPILESSNAAADFIYGEKDQGEATYVLKSRMNQLRSIKDSLVFAQSLISEQPLTGGERSGPYLRDIGNLDQIVKEIFVYSDQAMAGYSETIEGNLSAYRDAEISMMQAVNRSSRLVDIYYRLKLDEYPSPDHPDRSRLETIRYWDMGLTASIRLLRLRSVDANLEDNLAAKQHLDTAVEQLHQTIAKGRRDTDNSIAELEKLPKDYVYFDVEKRLEELSLYEEWWASEEKVALKFGELQFLLEAEELNYDLIYEALETVFDVREARDLFDERLLGYSIPKLVISPGDQME